MHQKIVSLEIYLGLSFAGSLAFTQRQMFLGRGKGAGSLASDI